uniref:sulfatase family protein n=1 Tax=uncultured Draconibacterium sp. TaxID=1573823 RepID=UPI003217857E
MRNLYKILFGAMLVFGNMACTQKNEQPNILLIITDDQGYADYSSYGGATDVSTPNMDRIANAGVRFTNGYATAPVCNASRAGIITGCYQERWGTFYYGGKIFPESQKTIPELLASQGYRCVKIGKTHYSEILDNNVKVSDPLVLREFPMNHGYEEFMGFCAHRHDYFKLRRNDNVATNADDERMSQYGPLWVNREQKDFEGYTTELFGDEAVRQIRKTDNRPFFMELSFNAVHHPIYQAPDKYLEKYGLEKFPDWNPEEESFLDYHARTCWRGEEDSDGRKRYLANLDCLDDNIGKVLDALQESGKWENTLIIFISDNGGSQNTYANNGILNGHKYILREGGIRTPFTMCWPDRFKGAKVVDVPVSHMDIAPTCMEAAKVSVDNSLLFDGKNLFPVIDHKENNHHNLLVWDTGNEWAVRKGDWKLHVVKKDNHFRTINLDAGTYLYNLDRDPGEKNNLAEKYPEKINELDALHKTWKESL